MRTAGWLGRTLRSAADSIEEWPEWMRRECKAMKTHRPEKRIALLVEALEDLVYASDRCSYKYGCHDDGTPSDWSEWVELRRCLRQALHALAREGKKP